MAPLPIPSLYPTASSSLSQGYILSLTPADASSSHLLLTHPSPRISVVDAQTLQLVGVLGGDAEGEGHSADVKAVCTGLEAEADGSGGGGEGGAPPSVWSASGDATVIRWDERTRRPGQRIRAFARRPLPLMSLAFSARDNLLVAGSELVGSDACIVYWDIRRPSEPIYTHSQTHSDDITHLSFLPPTRTLSLPSAHPSSTPLPPRLLLSASSDGLVALSDPRENDEDEACWSAEPLGASVARAGWYALGSAPGTGGRTRLGVWARSDMDSVGAWALEGGPEGAEVQMRRLGAWGPEVLRGVRLGAEETSARDTQAGEGGSYTARSDYVVDARPSLGVSSGGVGMLALGDNSGNLTLMHHAPDRTRHARRSSHGGEGMEGGEPTQGQGGEGGWRASAFLRSPAPGTGLGHRDVVRSMYYDAKTHALYTGSEDSVLCGWALPLDEGGVLAVRCGDPARDDDGGAGREEGGSDEEEEDDVMDQDEDGGSERSDSSGMSID